MPISYDKDLNTTSALSHAFSMAWAGVNHRVATIYVGRPPFNLGGIQFKCAEDIKDRILLAAEKADVQSHAYHGVISPGFSYLGFRQGQDYLRLMSEIHGRHIVSGSDLTVQVTGLSKDWHDMAQQKLIYPVNRKFEKENMPPIRVVQIDDHRTDYVFPTLASMGDFYALIRNGPLRKIEDKDRERFTASSPFNALLAK